MMIQLRTHQQDALDNIIDAIRDGNGTAKGRVVIPTGGGKTFIEAAALEYQMKNNHFTRVHLVLAPRILLVNQLIDEYRIFANNGYNVAAFHSGSYEPDDESLMLLGEVPNTTRKSEILEALQNATMRGRDLVVFSTYHSAKRLEGIDFDTLIADESQFCVSEGFHNDVKEISARVKLFFTATEKHTQSSLGRGLNNEDAYGKRLFYISPDELIRQGIILPPRLHVMTGKQASNESDTVLDQVIETAKAQCQLTAQLGFSKTLFAMKGTKGVQIIEDNMNTLKTMFPEHDVFTITSKTGAKINGVDVQRVEFMTKVKDCKSALIFHNDILSEGIDVDGITGIVLMRSMELAKLLQTIGRAVRIYKVAPTLKKCAWISVPVIDGNEDDLVYISKVINAIRAGGYNISAQEIEFTDNSRHIGDPTPNADAYCNNTRKKTQEALLGVFHDIERGEYWEKVIGTESPLEIVKLLAAA
jgi:superfamily II DNA or RNA helicase